MALGLNGRQPLVPKHDGTDARRAEALRKRLGVLSLFACEARHQEGVSDDTGRDIVGPDDVHQRFEIVPQSAARQEPHRLARDA